MKLFRVIILQYSDLVREKNDLANYLPPSSMKGQEYDEVDQAVRDKEFSENEICIATKDVLPTSMRDEIDNKDKDYLSVTHK